MTVPNPRMPASADPSHGEEPLCHCGHSPEMHEHYRAGRDCGECGREVCAGYRRRSHAESRLTAERRA